ncbi:hypothetical protein ABEV54_07080 [Peribacillus psychrosaccharolyticus]|uniref:hypothetical protein n=1 Tax=Peribacillus psychrosaccharolyticus TaxID=1407 RepID=UPI003D28D2FB
MVLEVLDFHRALYDARWNGEKSDDLLLSMAELEDELLKLMLENGFDYEEFKEMLSQLYIPPYKYDLLPEHLKHSNSAKKEKLGRPSLGVTKKISLTLPKDIWDKIEIEKTELDLKSTSAYFRKFILDHFKGSL